jgi:hypothetical protein
MRSINAFIGKRIRQQEESNETVYMGAARSERRSQHSHSTEMSASAPAIP